VIVLFKLQKYQLSMATFVL